MRYILLFFIIILNIYGNEEYSYPGGVFRKLVNNKWIEITASGEEVEYRESARDPEWITLFNSEFHKTINIPVKGGQAFEAIDDQKKKWKPLYITKNISPKKSEEQERIPKKKAIR